ncbi:PH domain-containing protein [Streptomyces griseorubiginosus]|uniref:PH domain-containing protein n=1 Tax=Streptomyces griseorubiginosus TaxID=67304 RepID=UPI002E80EF1D|nr:PH domain-containing protein [Streptomyces griseorubiginosus]WUB45655.1 PH domain-containing protein [Streptomyces griseorubiginosus]WUB54173.1 PH domain-containing protein [Streptomyces griseorubiginosus]
MDAARDGVIGVWRVSRSGRLLGYLPAAAPTAGALSTWPNALTHPSAQSARTAAIATAVALAFGLFAWWALLRVRLELRTDEILMVNPWGTQRLPWSRVTAVSLGNWGARFHTTDGFVFTAYALSDLAGGTRQDDRFAELRRLAETRF